jgi:hypothetical protein
MVSADRVSIPTQSYAEMRWHLQQILAGNSTATPKKREDVAAVVREWFCANDGMAHCRVAATILEHLNGGRGPDRAHCYRGLHGVLGGIRWDPKSIGQRVRHALKLPVDFSFRRLRSIPVRSWSATDKYFSAEDVRRLVERIQLTRSAQGSATVAVTVRQSRDGGDYLDGYPGHSVTMAPAAPSSGSAP